MRVKLISHSKPSKELISDGIYDVQELVAFCARVSNPGNQYNTETSEKLINYLINNLHWSPLEMVNVCLEVETTRDIARQLLRHRSFSFQEFSQRYADPVKELRFETREARLQDPKNRQNSIQIDLARDFAGRDVSNEWHRRQLDLISAVREHYQWAIDNGIAKEQARAVLPEGLTLSRLYVNGTLRSWLHYISVRSDRSTQLEHREIARLCAEVIADVFPMMTKQVKE